MQQPIQDFTKKVKPCSLRRILLYMWMVSTGASAFREQAVHAFHVKWLSHIMHEVHAHTLGNLKVDVGHLIIFPSFYNF